MLTVHFEVNEIISPSANPVLFFGQRSSNAPLDRTEVGATTEYTYEITIDD